MEIKVKEKRKIKKILNRIICRFKKKRKRKKKEIEELRDGELRYLDRNDIWRMIYIK